MKMEKCGCTKKSSHSSLTLILLLLAGITACSGRDDPREKGDEVVIGVLAPVASSFFRSGPPTVEGAQLAAAEINAAGGLDLDRRRSIRLVIEDTGDRPEIAVSKAFKLIDLDSAVALVGLTVSDSAVAVANVAEERRIPMISTLSTHPEVTRGKSYAFRVIVDDSIQARALAEFAYDDLAARQTAVLFDPGSTYSRGFAQEFRTAFEQRGGGVAAFETFTVDEEDITPQLRRIAASGADLVALPVYPAFLGTAVRQVRAIGITAPVVGGDSWNLVAASERSGWGAAFFSDVWTPDSQNPASQRFIEAYGEAYGRAPVGAAALAYDAISFLARAIEFRGNAEPESIRSALLAYEDFVGVTGTIRFEGTGDPKRSAVILGLAEDGTARLEKSLDP